MIAKIPRRIATALALALPGPIASAAGADALTPQDGRWHFQLVPYLWMPAVNGSVDAGVGGLQGSPGRDPGEVTLSAETDPDDYLGNLRAAMMLIGEARKGRWSIYTDLVYTRFNGEDAAIKAVTGPLGELSGKIGREAEVDISATIWTLGTGYTMVSDPARDLDLVCGFRYLALDTDLVLSLASQDGRLTATRRVAVDQDTWDVIVGVRGQMRIPDSRWFLPYYLDVGTGSSNWTWQALVGAGYHFDRGEVTLALRSISYELDKNNADVRFTGPALGVGFRW